MTLDENQKVLLDENVAASENALNPSASKSPRRFRWGISATLILGGVIGALWLSRSQVSQNAIVWALASKGVESEIVIKRIGPNGLEFESLRIGKKGQETLIAKHGLIDWHYEFGTNGLVIDNIVAKDLFGNFAITKNGFDFKDLAPLLKPSSGAKPTIIKNIDIQSAKVFIDSDYGPLRAHFDMKGSQSNGFKGLAKLFLPQQFLLNTSYYEKPIFLGFETGGFDKNRPSYIGLAANINENSLVGGGLMPELEAQKVSGNINASVIIASKGNSENNLYFNLYPSSLRFSRFSPSDGIDFLSGDIAIEKLYWNPNQNFASDSIFALNGDFDVAYTNFTQSSIENSRGKFEIARAEDGASFASIVSKIGAIRGPVNAAQSNLDFKINTKIPRLDEFSKGDIAGRIALNGNFGSLNIIANAGENLRQFGFGDFANRFGINLQAEFKKSKDKFWLGLGTPISINGAGMSKITFSPLRTSVNQAQNGLEFREKDGLWQLHALFIGALNGANNETARFNAFVNSMEIGQNIQSAQIRDIEISNLPLHEGYVSGQIRNLNFTNDNLGRSGNIDGDFILSQAGNIKLAPSKLRLTANMRNNIGKISLSGALTDFSGFGSRFDNSKLDLSGDFSMIGAGKAERIIGALNFSNQTGNIAAQNNIRAQGLGLSGNLNFDAPLGFKSGSNSNNSFSLKSNSFVINAGLINFDQYIAKDINLNSQIAMRGNLARDGKASFFADINSLNARAKRLDGPEIYGNNFQVLGDTRLINNANKLQIMGRDCLEYSLDNLRLAANNISKTKGDICPDNQRRFAQISNGKLELYSQIDTDNFKLQMGDLQNGQSLELGQVNAKFSPRKNGAIGIDIGTNKFEFRFKSGPETWATIYSTGAQIDVNSNKGGNDFLVTLDDLVTKDLPVLAKGALKGKFHTDAETGLSGDFSFNDIKIQDTETLKRFGDISLGGMGQIRHNRININAEAKNSAVGVPLAAFSLVHNINNGIGNIAFEAAEIEFSPYSRNSIQAKDIVPALQGIVEDANGKINGNANFSWAPNQPIQSNGVFSTDKFGFLSPLGPAEDISGTIALADLLKLRTETRQDVKVGLFHPGVPILDGKVGISFPGDNSIQLEEASWPFADGNLRIRRENWPFSAKDKDLTIDVDNIDVAKFLRLTELKNLEIDGRMTGVLPIQIRDNEVSIVGGILRAKDGGTFRYTGPDLGGEKPKKTTMTKLKERMFGKPPPQGLELAIEALRELKYKVLEIRVDGRITGNLNVFVLLEGQNKDVLNGHPFLFRINIDLPLMQALDSVKGVFDPNKQFNILNPDGTIKEGIEIEGVEPKESPPPQR